MKTIITYTLYRFNYLLTEIIKIAIITPLIRRHSQVVRQRSAKPLFSGSSPLAASEYYCRSGEIGRRKGLKIPRTFSSCRFKSGLRHFVPCHVHLLFFFCLLRKTARKIRLSRSYLENCDSLRYLENS